MIIKLIACEVFTREICICAAHSPHIFDIEFTPKGAHNDPDYFRQLIKNKINDANNSERKYDAIALCLGICGNSTIGITSPGIPIVIPRAHDCCTLFLGSKQKFKDIFADKPSSSFNSVGYIEHGGDFIREANAVIEKTGLDKKYEDLVNEFGEDNAKFIFDTLHKHNPETNDNNLFYIEIPELEHLGYAKICEEKAKNENKKFVKITGSLKIIKKLLLADWDNENFLIVEKGKTTKGIYDLDEIIACE